MRDSWWIWLIAFLVALAICGWLWTQLSGCRDELDKCKDALDQCKKDMDECCGGPPTGGPDIDITIGGGGAASYSIDGTPASPNASGTLDRRFFYELDRVSLMDTTIPKAWAVPDVKVHFNDGTRVEGIPDPANGNKLVWTCYDAAGNGTALAEGSAGSGVPACMAKVVQGGSFSYAVGGGTLTGNWIHTTTFQ